jgi:hypothetical protein
VIDVKKFAFAPILGWSLSRYDLFLICKRRYFYQYYTKYDQEIPTRQINQFKELVSIPLETGGIVHKVIEVLLTRLKKTSKDIDRKKFFDFARRTAEYHIKTNKFEEVVYGDLTEVEVDALFPKVRGSLENLLASDRFDWLINEAISSSDEWIIDPPGYGDTRIGALKVFCKVDFLFPDGGKFHIIDWKTGKPDIEKHRKQLIGYSTWTSYNFEADPTNVKPTIVYLHPEYQEVQETFNVFDLENFAIQVRAETEEMYEYCRDIEQNIPLDKAEFPMVDDQRICTHCNFRGICYPDLYPANL